MYKNKLLKLDNWNMTYVQQFTIKREGNLSLSCIELVCIWLHTVTCFNEQGLATKQKYLLTILTCWKHWRCNLVNSTDFKISSSFRQRCKVSRNNSSPFNIPVKKGHVISRYSVVKARIANDKVSLCPKSLTLTFYYYKHNCHCHSVPTLVSADELPNAEECIQALQFSC